MIDDEERSNYETFRDCLSGPVIQKSAVKSKPKGRRSSKGRKNAIKPIASISPKDAADEQDADDLAEFVDYLATEIFTSLPSDLRTLSYAAVQNDPSLSIKYTDPIPQPTLEVLLSNIPPSVSDTLLSYALLPDLTYLPNLLTPMLTDYITATTSTPPPYSTTRTTACEICERDWIPLTYHHLIPKEVHAKALKRGWHEEWTLNSVAWLCRACHSFVHRVASNEELAREWWSVERLRGREDVIAWAKWVGRVRWKAR
ncbi:MAG: hypothetical protein M1812_000319 [Candelaria pacifica]|nr:MAG: hypothetical protein M1812_000319 [Candelaria pacifica]